MHSIGVPNSIKWYVDGQLKHTATNQIPTTPGKIMMNLWNGTGVDEWLGSYNGVNPLYAHYDWVRYTKNNAKCERACCNIAGSYDCNEELLA